MSPYNTSPGDTLESIARKLGSDWGTLFEANRDTVLGHIARGFALPHNTSIDVPDVADAGPTQAEIARVDAWERRQPVASEVRVPLDTTPSPDELARFRAWEAGQANQTNPPLAEPTAHTTWSAPHMPWSAPKP
jgi:phage tail protein X